MKALLILAVCWYAQDLAQILMTQTFLAPEIFAVGLLNLATRNREPDSFWPWLVAAFCGGLLTDLRWIGVPGLCGALYTGAVLAARWLWYEVPSDGRKMIPYLIINGALCMVLSPPRLLFWDASVTSGRIMTILNAQWLLTGVAVLAASLTRRYSYDEEL